MLKHSSRYSGSDKQNPAGKAQNSEHQSPKLSVQDKKQETAARYRAVKWLAEKCLLGLTSLWLICAYSLYDIGVKHGILVEADIISIKIYALITLTVLIICFTVGYVYAAGKGDAK